LSCREFTHATTERHRRIVISDKNVRPLRSDGRKWLRVDDLVRKGDVSLEDETRQALKALYNEIEAATPTLTALSQDTAESSTVKDCARDALKTLANLPVVSGK
jgi:hypothetical protein